MVYRIIVHLACNSGCWFSAGCPRISCPTRVKNFFVPAVKTLLGRARSGVPIDLSTPDVFLVEFQPPSKSGPESPGHREERSGCKTKH